MVIEMMAMGFSKRNKKEENIERQLGKLGKITKRKKRILKKAHFEFFKFSLFDFSLA
jgi:hypothetical protein